MTSETEALCGKVSEHRSEWREDYDAPCGSCGHRKVCHGRNRGCAVWQFDGHTCGCATYQPQPLDWTLPENAWKLLEEMLLDGRHSIALKRSSIDVHGADDFVHLWVKRKGELAEAVLKVYCRLNGLTPSTEGR